MRARLMLLAAAMGMILLLETTPLHAQVPILELQRKSYDVEIVSQFGFPVRVGMFGYSGQATFRIDFDGGRTGPDVYEQELVAGDRVVCVWDRNQNLILVAALTIDSDGVLVLSPAVYGAAGAPAAAREGAQKGGMPQLKIRPQAP